MKGSALQRLDQRLRHLLPLALTLFLVLLDATPTRLPGFAAVSPMLPLIGVYYWAVFRPDLVGPAAAFALGIVHDIVAGTPLGVTPLIYLLVQGLTASQRRFFLGKHFMLVWWGFAMIAGGAVTLQWGLVSLIFGKLVAPSAVGFELLMTVCFYPLISWLFARVQLALLQRA